jgi:pseudaminic acid synthase
MRSKAIRLGPMEIVTSNPARKVKIGKSAPPFIVAEISGNHNQSLGRGLEIIEAAAKAGVHGIKLQTYTPDTMTLDINEREFFISDSKSLWKGQNLYDLYKEAHTPWEWHKPLFERAQSLGLVCFSTPFDASAVDFLDGLNAPLYKIASQENTDIPLIRKAASTGKPLVISTGMATMQELEEAVFAARDAGCKDLILLKCTSSYPASPEDSNILTIPYLRERFGVEVGLSDHTLGIGVAVASVSLGGVFIEKHFTLSRADGGVDSAFSMEPQEMKALVEETYRAWLALGSVQDGPTEVEKKGLIFRRTLYVVEDIRAGETFTLKNVRAIRPGLGLPPKFLDSILGKKALKDLRKGTPLSLDFVSK